MKVPAGLLRKRTSGWVAPHEILAVAEQIGAGVVVIGSRGLGGLRRALLGSVSESVVRHAHCPVFIVRKEESEVGITE